MRNRIAITITLILLSLIASAAAALGAQRNHLSALAAKQDLCGEVSVAMAKGYITPKERAEILADAKKVLTAAEYPAFQRALDRIAPPSKAAPKRQSTPQRSAQVQRLPAPTPPAARHYYRGNNMPRRPVARAPAARPATPRQNPPETPPALIAPQQAAPLPPKLSPTDGPVIPTSAIEPERTATGLTRS